MGFRQSFPVRFGDIDEAGVVYYPRLFDYFHKAFEDFWSIGLGRAYPGVLKAQKVGYPSVHVETDFRAPLRYGDTFEIAVGVRRIGRRSVTWLYQGFQSADQSMFVSAEVTTACVDIETFKTREVPDDHRSLLEPHLVTE